MKKSLFYSLSLSSAVLLGVTGCQASKTFGPSAKSSPKPAASTSAATTTAPLTVSPSVSVAAVTPNLPAPGTGGRITTASGLQYEVLASGPAGGRSPTPSDSVTVHYHGTLPSGTVFDSSVERGQPATFGVSQVIPGWTEALQLMKPGDKWMLYIPFRLGYGSQAMGKIPPFSDLIFQVEMLQIVGGQ